MKLDLGLIPRRKIKIIKLNNEPIPPKPSFHNAKMRPARPAIQNTNVIIIKVSNVSKAAAPSLL